MIEKGGRVLERKNKKRSYRERPVRNIQDNNIRELRPEDFSGRQADRDYALRPLYSSQSETETSKPARTRAAVPDAKQRNREAVRRRKRVVRTKTTAKEMKLPAAEESDFTLIACVLLLSFIGLVMVTSSGYYYGYTHMDDGLYFFRRQFMWLAVGLVAMVGCRIAPLWMLKRFARIIYWVSIGCSALVLVIGQTKNGSTRWLGVGSLSFQPAELAKIAVAVYISVLVEENQDTIHTWKTFFRLLIAVLLPTGLVTVENLSSEVGS